MRKMGYYVIGLLLVGFWVSCRSEQGPESLAPVVGVDEAVEITRTTARLTGTVRTTGEELITVLRFRYGDSEEMKETMNCRPENAAPSVLLTGLSPHTTYYYQLEAGNGMSSVQSAVRTFTTLPDEAPVLGALQVLAQGPLSIQLQCEVSDDGGQPLLEVGFYYWEEGGKEEKRVAALGEDNVFLQGINGLRGEAAYTVQAFAANVVGETRSESYCFHTGQTVTVSASGQLSEVLDYRAYRYPSLNIAGPLNGTDLLYLREMLEWNAEEASEDEILRKLDLTDATICAGGVSYDGMRYASDRTVGTGLFAQCTSLRELFLPIDTEVIEENAFKDCTGLVSLHIPFSVSRIVPSEGCMALDNIEVSVANPLFGSKDGVLYDKALGCLLWFPEGKDAMVGFPETLKTIAEYALRNYPLTQINLPAGLKEVGRCAFYGAHLESAVLPDGIETIPEGLFQGCSSLVSVTLGSGTGYLSNYCFEGCSLQELHIKVRDFLPMCQENTFPPALYETCVLYVPKGSRSAYTQSRHWKKFTRIKEE